MSITTIKKRATAKKLTVDNPQSKQLVTFVSSLGVNKALEVYSCNEQVYINVDVVLPILSVELAWFHKNAEIITHYIILNKVTYINKYGMTKLISQSKQPAAFRLQDYLYELFYRVETEGTVNRDSLVTRKQLLEITDELNVYKDIIEKNKNTIDEAREVASAALNDYNCIEQENAKLLKHIERNELEMKELSDSLETYKTIANKLARYVRAKSKNPADEAFSDALDIEDEEDPSDLSVVTDAIKAKAKLKNIAKVTPKAKITPKTSNPKINGNQKTIYIMRSVMCVDDNFNYQWSITGNEPSEALINDSEWFLSGDVSYVPHIDICYRALTVTEEKLNAMVLFLELVNYITDAQTMEKLM